MSQKEALCCLQKGAHCKDNFFLEQMLSGLVSANAIGDLLNLSKASGMFVKLQKHLLRAGGLPPFVKPNLNMSLTPLVGLDAQQVRL